MSFWRSSTNLDLLVDKNKIAEQSQNKKEVDKLINSINSLRSNYSNILKDKDFASTFAIKCYNDQKNCINSANTKQDANIYTIKCFNNQQKCLNDASLRQTTFINQKNETLRQIETKFNELSAQVQSLDYTIRIAPLPTSSSSPYASSEDLSVKMFPGTRRVQSAPAPIGSPQQLPNLGQELDPLTSSESGYGVLPSEDIPSSSPEYQYGIIPGMDDYVDFSNSIPMDGGARKHKKISKRKISKRKTSKHKTSKRKTSKRKTSKRKTSKRKTSKRKISKRKTSKRKISKRKTSIRRKFVKC